ncbi:carboxypeptidase-like regulatory domain-containing protein [Marinigracilibium pacificum]|uniref:Outer membrane beta-barrel protein n=1 Tax=Marinigracilibium pacificum TaxID=2729599 RepID=A0A848J221_9BACT|nr:carboxypeptidase-like regulatory domain-containing protein [Marinigracilibium pacificum]NMM50873.1 outer membrane beta-barrel protein [Marinigracilibium pacificum]
MKRILFIFFSLFFTCIYSQNLSFYGVAIDSTGSAVEFANVVAIDPETDQIGSFAITNAKGEFKLILKEKKTFLLRITYVGYKKFEQYLMAEENKANPQIFTLHTNTETLNEFQVVADIPVLISGDTIIYKAEAFANGRERKLGDLLKKMPGIEIDINGEVKVQGKKVNKVMIEGKTFFDGDTKLATKNIPANVVDKVQVLKDYSEASPMKGLKNDDELALNIKLKDGKTNLIFGDITAGIGPEKRYSRHANTFYYSEKLSSNLIADANNIGEEAFTISDYFRFTGGLSSISNQSGTEININQDMGIPMTNRSNATELNNHFGALNINFSLNKRWRHSAFAIGFNSKNKMASRSYRSYLNTEENQNEILNTTDEINQNSGMVKYTTTFTPSENTFAKYSLFSKFGELLNSSNLFSIFEDTDNNIILTRNRDPFDFDQQFNLYHSFNKNQIFSADLSANHKRINPELNLITDQSTLSPIININPAEEYNLTQYSGVKSNQYNAVLNFYQILNRTNHISLKTGFSQTNQKFTSNITQTDQEVNRPVGSDDFINNSTFRNTNIYFGAGYKAKWGQLIFNPSFTINKISIANTNQESSSYSKTLFLPELYTKLDLTRSQSITLRYNATALFPDIQKLAPGYIITDYNSLYKGNPSVNNGIYHNLSVNYRIYRLVSGFSGFARLGYQRKLNEITPIVNFEGTNRINTPDNIGEINEAATFIFNSTKKFNSFLIEGGADISYQKTNFYSNDQPVLNKSWGYSYNLGIVTTILKSVDLELGYRERINDYKSTINSSIFITRSPYAEININFLKNFSLKPTYEYNFYKSKTINTQSEYSFLDVYFSYRKGGSPWEFGSSLYNALDTRAIRQDSFTESLISTYEYYVQKRYLMFYCKFDL